MTLGLRRIGFLRERIPNDNDSPTVFFVSLGYIVYGVEGIKAL